MRVTMEEVTEMARELGGHFGLRAMAERLHALAVQMQEDQRSEVHGSDPAPQTATPAPAIMEATSGDDDQA